MEEKKLLHVRILNFDMCKNLENIVCKIKILVFPEGRLEFEGQKMT